MENAVLFRLNREDMRLGSIFSSMQEISEVFSKPPFLCGPRVLGPIAEYKLFHLPPPSAINQFVWSSVHPGSSLYLSSEQKGDQHMEILNIFLPNCSQDSTLVKACIILQQLIIGPPVYTVHCCWSFPLKHTSNPVTCGGSPWPTK